MKIFLYLLHVCYGAPQSLGLGVESKILDRLLYGLPEFADWMANNEHVLWWIAASSLLIFVGSLILIPWLIVRIPADYFVEGGEQRSSLSSVMGPHPFAIALLKVLRNIVGIVFIIVGVFLLVLPGQGLLTIFLGVVISDFPGKRRAVNWLVAQRSVHRPINWLRQRAGKKPLTPPNLK